jgi:hypothetical protein
MSNYNISGGIQGAVGDNAHAENFSQSSLMAQELASLSTEMAKRANTPEEMSAAKHVAEAEQSLKNGNEQAAIQKLKSAGIWALQIATELGKDVAAKVISKQLGL